MITALVFVFMFGPWIIDHLRLRQGKGQPIRTDGPKSHIVAKAGTLVQSDGERLIADWLTAHNIAYRYDERYRILSGHAIRPDFYLPELDVYIEYWGMDSADYSLFGYHVPPDGVGER